MYNGDNYGSHIRCRVSGFEFSATHATKPGTLIFLKKIVMHIEKNLGCKIKFCRLDGESTFGHKFRDFMADRAIYIERTAPDTSEQNGGLESSGGVIVIKTRSFIIGAALPSKLWIEAFNSATYIKNRTPHRHLDWKTPYKAVHKI